jgi:hypothetical protein
MASSRRIRERGRKGCCKVFFNQMPKICMDLLLLLFQTLEDKEERGKLQCISSRGWGECWRGQWDGLWSFKRVQVIRDRKRV